MKHDKRGFFGGDDFGKYLSSAGLVERFRSHVSQGTKNCSEVILGESFPWFFGVEKWFIKIN